MKDRKILKPKVKETISQTISFGIALGLARNVCQQLNTIIINTEFSGKVTSKQQKKLVKAYDLMSDVFSELDTSNITRI